MNNKDTIVAQATPSGYGGIGVLRISGDAAKEVALAVLGKIPAPRYVTYKIFRDAKGNPLDQGIALWFPAPNSFTGEDVLELQGHGGPVILDILIKRILELPNLRIARPGEFSERAFINNKIDLIQAEAVADLINVKSERAALSAMRSLQGVFSNHINQLIEALIHLRVQIESSINFPEEEIIFLSNRRIEKELNKLIANVKNIKMKAHQGSLLREGIKVVIAGPPNAGKSSLLNTLSEREAAIVTNIPGTTRDVLREYIHIDSIPLHIIDTAGLRESKHPVEQIGIERAWSEIKHADRVLFIVDSSTTIATDPIKIYPEYIARISHNASITIVRNKADISKEKIGITETNGYSIITISAHTGDGINILRNHLKNIIGFKSNEDSSFLARRRHLQALEKTLQHLIKGRDQFIDASSIELLAIEVQLAQQSLNEITGEFSSDDLLGRIFSSFCIGK